MNKRYRVTHKNRFCIFLTVIFLILFGLIGNMTGHSQAISMTKPAYTEIMIISGDTLWDLAKEYGPADKDTRRVVHSIYKINDITADRLKPGQRILIPEYL
ncbi:MAG TPA: LysM peptidoglycan-binding domain-containing protein [Anaerovoracaceae bacterium]|nr:LysM peptidoglycan-binding domain-containing protein [Anaerovoracaceae bacterium]